MYICLIETFYLSICNCNAVHVIGCPRFDIKHSTLSQLHLVITEVLLNYRHVVNQFNVMQSKVLNFLCSLSLQIVFCFLSIWWNSQSSEEWHIADCPCPSKMGIVCIVNNWFTVTFCHVLNGNQLVQFRDLPTKLS
jgi:hypothetical protein